MEDQKLSTVVPILETDRLDEKAVQCFSGTIVRKDLTSMMKRAVNVPTFVLEYLLGMYCSTDDSEVVADGISQINNILTNNYVHPDESETIKSKIKERGKYRIIDKVSARLDEYSDVYVAEFTNLAIDSFLMPAEYVREYTKILQGGIWCIMTIEYLHPAEHDFENALANVFDEKPNPRPKKGKTRGPENSPFHILSLTPIQMPNLDLANMMEIRQNFTTEEWLDLLLRSCGYEPNVLTERQKLHFIARMIPLAEHNYNLCELGPRSTGKSYVYKEISPYSILLSGGQTTTANLFGYMNPSRHASSIQRTGLVGSWDCVTFDEVAGMHFKDMNAIQILKDYMASGSHTRGRDQLTAGASVVFEGNTNDSVSNMLKRTHLFEPFPPEFNNDSAFFDRIHLYLPGWEVPKLKGELLTNHYGLITDCLSEFCREMRKYDYSDLFDGYFRLNNDFKQRDSISVRKTFSGLAKLLFPDKRMTKDETRWILEYAIEGRRRVKEQLKLMAGVEFSDVDLGYIDLETEENHVVYVPEQSDDTLVRDSELTPGYVYAIGRAFDGDMAIYRLENKAVAGEFKLATEGIGSNKKVKDSIQAAFKFFENSAGHVAPGIRGWNKEYLMFYNDLQKKGPSPEVTLAEFIGLCSAASSRSVVPGMAIPGVLHMSGTMESLDSLEDILRVAINAGAKRILLPFSCIEELRDVPDELVGSIGTDFYPDGNAVAAARKALDL